jgi:hypothetical protein
MSPATNKTVKFVLATATAGLVLAAASGPSFAGRPFGPHHPPACDSACQTNKAIPPAKLQPAKPTGAADTGGRSAHPR